MIDFHKFLTLSISLIIVINSELISGENKFRKNVSKIRSKSTLSKPYIRPLDQTEDVMSDVAETRAQFSVVSADHDLSAAAGGKYFQYARSPGKKSWEFGYKRGNPHHYREQHEQGHGDKFKTKLKWGDHKGGHGEHYWDYNHSGKHGHGGGGGGGFGGGGHGGHKG